MLLIVIASVQPKKSSLSSYELLRRVEANDESARVEWRRTDLYPDVRTMQRIIAAWLLVSLVAVLVNWLGWFWGIIAALGVALTYTRIASSAFIARIFQVQYDRHEQAILSFTESIRRFLRPLRGAFETERHNQITSREEFKHLVDESKNLLTAHERLIIESSLSFEAKKVKDYMTPRSVMEAIGMHELLGPLVLDGLYRTGHSHFPVFDGDIDHIVGMLHLHGLVALRDKDSKTVKDIMEPKVLYIHEDQLLDHALSACIKHRRHLLVAINDYRETMGVITIEDAVEQLIGRKIVDEFAAHDDLRAVAARNPRKNNLSSKGSDV